MLYCHSISYNKQHQYNIYPWKKINSKHCQHIIDINTPMACILSGPQEHVSAVYHFTKICNPIFAMLSNVDNDLHMSHQSSYKGQGYAGFNQLIAQVNIFQAHRLWMATVSNFQKYSKYKINCILERKLMLNILENIFYSDLFTFKIV